jgi:amidase
VLARTVRDAAAVLDVMTGITAGEPAWSPRPAQPYAAALADPLPRLRIAVTTTPVMGDVSDAAAAATAEAAAALSALGHKVEDATPDWMAILSAAMVPMSVPGAAALISPDDVGRLEPRNRPMVERLASLTIVEHARQVDLVREATRDFLSFWERYDVLLTPTCGLEAPPVELAPWDQTPEEQFSTLSAYPIFAQPFNVSGQPAISLPTSQTADGLPMGVQLVARPLEESTILALAAELEAALPWADRHPSNL